MMPLVIVLGAALIGLSLYLRTREAKVEPVVEEAAEEVSISRVAEAIAKAEAARAEAAAVEAEVAEVVVAKAPGPKFKVGDVVIALGRRFTITEVNLVNSVWRYTMTDNKTGQRAWSAERYLSHA